MAFIESILLLQPDASGRDFTMQIRMIEWHNWNSNEELSCGNFSWWTQKYGKDRDGTCEFEVEWIFKLQTVKNLNLGSLKKFKKELVTNILGARIFVNVRKFYPFRYKSHSSHILDKVHLMIAFVNNPTHEKFELQCNKFNFQL